MKHTHPSSTASMPEEASGGPEPTAFISGYTDLRNEVGAPNVLSYPVSHYIPCLAFSSHFLTACLLPSA